MKYLLLIFLFIPFQSFAAKPWLCRIIDMDICDGNRSSRGSMASAPSTAAAVRINPAAIPKDRGFGGEVVTARGAWDYGLVSGTGKVGAVALPSSLEDTFYANIPIEDDTEYENRILAGEPYDSKKYTFGTAFALFSGKGKYAVNVDMGVLAKYNSNSKNFLPGAGLTIGMGPLSLNASYNQDDTWSETNELYRFKYKSSTIGASLLLPFVAIDYSIVKNMDIGQNIPDTEVTITSLTFFWKKFMFTYAWRKEDSHRPQENVNLVTGETFFDYTVREKTDGFLGLQYAVKDNVVVGLFQNYFMVDEWSVGLTLFF